MTESIREVFFKLNSTDSWLLAGFGFLYVLRLLYWLFFEGRFLFERKKNELKNNNSAISILMTERNESENLQKNLPDLLNINNSSFEVVVVDDFSSDDSYTVLGILRDRYKNIKVSSLNQETRYSEKMAQNIALKAASFDWVVPLSAAFCNASDEWLKNRIESLNPAYEVVAGYSSLVETKGWYAFLYRIENFYLYIKSAGFIAGGLPFVYSEQNVAFKKHNYFKVGGYAKKVNEPFANLELIINQFINKKTTRVLIQPQAIVKNNSHITREDYYELLKKTIRIEKNLSGTKYFVLRFEEITKLLFLPYLGVTLLLYSGLWPIILSLLFLQVGHILLIIKIAQKRLNEPKIFISSLVYGLLTPYFKILHRWHFNYRSRKQKWRSM